MHIRKVLVLSLSLSLLCKYVRVCVCVCVCVWQVAGSWSKFKQRNAMTKNSAGKRMHN